MTKLLLCGIYLALLQGTLVVGQGPKIGSKNNFKAFQSLPSLRCNGNGFGRAEKLLKNYDRILEMENTLQNDTQVQLFRRIQNNKDFDLSNVGEDDAKVILKQLMDISKDARDQYLNLSQKWQTMSSTERKIIFKHPKTLIILKKSVFCSIQEESTEDELSEYCTRLEKESVSTSDLLTSLDRCPYCAALLVDRRTDSSQAWTSSRGKCEAVMEKITQRFPDGWDVDFLRICPMVIKTEDVRRISQETFCKAAQLEKFADSDLSKILPRDILDRIGTRLIDCKGDLSLWTREDIKKYLRYVVRLPPNLLKPLDFTNVVDVIDDIIKEEHLQDTFFLPFAARKIANAWTATADSLLPAVRTKLLCVMMSASANRKMIYKDISVGDLQAFLENATSQCGNLKIQPSAIQLMVDRVTSQVNFTWTYENVGIFVQYVGELSPRVIQDIPLGVRCSSWRDMKDHNVHPIVMNIVFNKPVHVNIFGDLLHPPSKREAFYYPPFFKCYILKQLGPLVFVLFEDVFTEIPDAYFGTCIKNISNDLNRFCERFRARCRLIMDKVVRYSNDNHHIKLGTIIAGLGPQLVGSMRSFDGVELEDIGGLDAIDNNIRYHPAQARALLKLIERKIGPFNSSNPEFCDKFPKLRPLMVVAGDDSMWDNVCEDGNLIENIAAAAPDIGEMSSSNIEAIIEKLLQVFNAKNQESVCVDKSLIQQVAPFLLYARPEDILRFDRNTRRAILKSVSSDWGRVRGLNPVKVKFFTAMTFANEGLSRKAIITEEEIDRIGTFALCGMTKDQVVKLDDDALRRFFPELLSCPHLDEETLQALAKKLKPVTENFGESYIPKMGAAIRYVLDELTAEQKQERKEILVSHLREFSGKIRERIGQIGQLDRRVSQPDKNKEYRDKYLAAMHELITYAIEAKTANQEESRHKRAAGDLDCSILADIKNMAGALTVSQISGMDTTEVKRCLFELSETSWDPSKCEAWRSHLVSANGFGSNTSAWNKTDVQGLGTLIACLTSSEIQALNVDESVLTALGRTNVGRLKAEDVIIAYLNTSRTRLANISDFSLTNMGHMFCGLSMHHILQLPSTAILTSVKDLSKLGCMWYQKLAAVTTVIVSRTANDWSDQDPFLVQELGVWMAGVSKNVWQTFGPEHIKRISKEAIRAITRLIVQDAFDNDTFSEFTREQMNWFIFPQSLMLPKPLRAILHNNTDYNINFNIIDVNDGADTTAKSGEFSTGVTSLPGRPTTGAVNGVSPLHLMTSLPIIMILGRVARMLH